jgi:cytoskeletal protein RodZ
MQKVGAELKQAREHAGLSAEQIAERTKIKLHKIVALEEGDFQSLPQGIYLDGIVRAYAHEVALDPDALVERVRSERGALPGDWPVPFETQIDLHGTPVRHESLALDDIPVLDGSGENDPLNSFSREADLTDAPIARPQHDVPPAPRIMTETPPVMPQAPPAIQIPARPTRQRAELVVPVLLLLAAAGLGVYFYQAAPPLARETAPPVAESSSPRQQMSPEPVSKDAPAPFTENVIAPDTSRPAPSDANANAAPQDTPRSFDTPIPSPPTRSAEPTAAAAASSTQIGTTGSISNVSGAWTLATRVESSSLARFKGLQLGYRMQLEQNGDRVTGVGRKVAENGSAIRSRAQTPVSVNGTINGDRLTLNFTERGARRPTRGKFDLLLDETGTLRGRFTSTAARSSGTVEAQRVQ